MKSRLVVAVMLAGLLTLSAGCLTVAAGEDHFKPIITGKDLNGTKELAADHEGALYSHKVATFSIVAVDPETGICGAAVASKYPSVGHAVLYVRAGVGAFCTQHHHVPEWGERALDLLEAGRRPEAVFQELLKDDPEAEHRRNEYPLALHRQLGIIDIRGRTAVHNPAAAPKTSQYWGAMAGRHYCCQGNTLTGREVIAAMAEAYEDTQGSFTDRLMAALVAGDCAGGDHRGRLAAGIRVAKTEIADDWFALSVNESDDAVIELLQQYAQAEHEAKGNWRGGQLPFQHPCKSGPAP